MTVTKEKTKVEVGLEPSRAEEIADHLNMYLSSLQVLNTKLHNYHWNVEGEAFFTLHEVLEDLYTAGFEEIDDVAERILKIGFRPLAKLEDYVARSVISEVESVGVQGPVLVASLIEDYHKLVDMLRDLIEIAEKHGDEGTADDAIAFLKDKEKRIWMLTAYNTRTS
ncbi:MAG: Dps family protein [Spirochaetota bacterium]